MRNENMDLEKYRPNREFLLYKTSNGDVKVDVLLQNETIWMPQKKIAELFDVNVPAVSKHLKNIFESGELNETVVVSILETTTQHGAITGKTQSTPTKYYNLDAIIAVGYRVNSKRATQFRIWATTVLKEFIIKGYTMDVERLKNPQPHNIIGFNNPKRVSAQPQYLPLFLFSGIYLISNIRQKNLFLAKI